ncbi:MAG: UDP-N-acetylmuramate dehydrogenase, partial [Clostridia bacterium]|nr:UDP-N-acetylmuramate dehydrogenase [Clostridia bacterium]
MPIKIYTESPFDFTRHSTIGCGGLAHTAYYPQNEEEVLYLLSTIQDAWVAVGNLSNVLPFDEGTKKTVICTKKLTEIREEEEGIFVAAGVTSGALLRYMKDVGYTGAEFFAGIPCTLGGMLYMNGGAGGKYVAEIVKSVRVIRNGKVLNLPVSDCEYAYKNSVFMRTEDFLLGALLHLEKSDKQAVEGEIHRWYSKRVHLPKGKSMGCVFKNPQGGSAGALIEGAGLKGVRVGGAKVSELHANFIINDQNATAKDICLLIQKIKAAVYEKYGVVLEEEIR